MTMLFAAHVLVTCFSLGLVHDVVAIPAAANSVTTNLVIPEKAIAPTCLTKLVPTSSSCWVGINPVTKREAQPVTIPNKAKSAGCETFYSTSTSCAAGVHPQPTSTFTGVSVTVTKLTVLSPSASPVKTTVATVAALSVAAEPSGSAAGSWTLLMTHDLRRGIVNLAEEMCSPGKHKRQESFAPSCSLPSTNEAAFLDGVGALINGDVAVAVAANIPNLAYLSATVLAVEIFKLWSQSSVQPLGLSITVGGGAISSVAKSSSSSSPPPLPTYYAAAPNNGYSAMPSSDMSRIASYMASLYGIRTTSSSACHFGTSVGATTTSSYCICTDGFYHPISPVTQTTTVSGTAKKTVDYCAYATPPSSTINPFPIASPISIPPPTTAAAPSPTTTPPATLISQGVSTCFYGASAFKDQDMSSAISQFCSEASKSKWSVTATDTLTSYGRFSNGAAQTKWSNYKAGPVVYSTATDNTVTELGAGITFNTRACPTGKPHTLDLTDKSMCISNFLAIEDNCDTKKVANGMYWKHGGMRYANCAEWNIQGYAA